MTRPPRIDPEGGWHHVMNRGVNRQDIFVDDLDRTEFLRLLGVAVERHDIELHAYCLMSNHFHLLVRCPAGGVSQLTQWLTSRHATSFNERHGRVGHVFGGRFTSRLVDTEAYCLNAARYIHRNPLDIATVASAGDYRWSSHRSYLGLRRRPAWLCTDWILGWFDGRDDYADFVDGTVPHSPAVDREIDPATLLSVIDTVLAERSQERSRALGSERRAIALAVAVRVGSPLLDRIHDELGHGTVSGRLRAAARASRWIDDHPDASEQVRLAMELLTTPMRPRRRAA